MIKHVNSVNIWNKNAHLGIQNEMQDSRTPKYTL